jgi:tetratricopeptide (TPR) repeat protein
MSGFTQQDHLLLRRLMATPPEAHDARLVEQVIAIAVPQLTGPDGILATMALANALDSRWQSGDDPEDWAAAVAAYQRLVPLPETHLAARGSIAKLLSLRYTRSTEKDLDLLRLTINMLVDLLADTPPRTAAHAGRAMNLGTLLSAGIQDHRDREIFEYADTLFRELIATVPEADSHKATLMVQLADMLLVAYLEGWRDDAIEALDLLDLAAGQITGGPWRLSVVRRAGIASLHRVQLRLDRAELQRSLRYLSEAAAIDPDPWLQLHLATALSMRAEFDWSEADLRRAGSILADLLPRLVPGSEEHLAALVHLGDIRSQLADRAADERAVSAAIELLTEATAAAEERGDRSTIAAVRGNLAVAFGIRARLTKRSEDLSQAIDSLLGAQQAAPDLRSEVLAGTRLGSALLQRYLATDDDADLRRAVDELEAAIALHPPGVPASVTLRRDLAVARAHAAVAPDAVDDALSELLQLRAEVQEQGHSDASLRPALLAVLAIKHRADPDVDVLAALNAPTDGHLSSEPPDAPMTAERAVAAGGAGLDHYLSTGSFSELENAIGVLRIGITRPAPPAQLAQLHDLLGKAMQQRFRITFHRTDLDEAIAANRQATNFADPDQTLTAVRLVNLANGLRLCFEAYRDQSALLEATQFGRHAVKLLPAGHPERARALSSLGHSLAMGAESVEAVDELVEVRRRALDESAPDAELRPTYSLHLARALIARFRLGHVEADRSEVIQVVDRLQAMPNKGPAQRDVHLADLLCQLLQLRFDDAELDRATRLVQTVITATPDGHPTQTAALQKLIELLRLSFEHHGKVVDLDRAIAAAERLLSVLAPDHPARAGITADLGWVLVLRARRTNTSNDLEAGLALIEEAISLMPPAQVERPNALIFLADARRFHYESGWGDHRDLAAAIRSVTEAWQLPAAAPERIRTLTTAAALSLLRFEVLGDPKDLDHAVDSGRAAGQVPTDEIETAVASTIGLAHALRERFEYGGSARDLEESIAAVQHAHATADRDHLRAAARMAGGLIWQARYEQTRQLEDIDRAIRDLRAALDLTAAGTPDRATVQYNLGVALHRQFQNTKEPETLNQAITALRAAASSTTATSPARSRALAVLGAALRTRFARDRQTEDLQDAVAVHEEAVATVTGTSDRRVALTNLAATLTSRAGLTENPDDLRSAIDTLRIASDLDPAEHPQRCTTLSALGDTLLRFASTDGPSLVEEAADRFRLASSLRAAPPQDRVRAAHAWADAAHDLGDLEQSVEGFQVAVELLPQMAWHGLTQRTRERHLAQVGGLAPTAAAAATLVQRNEEAVELLEAGRSVLWTQALSFSADLTSLSTKAPTLEKRLRELSRELSQGSAGDVGIHHV